MLRSENYSSNLNKCRTEIYLTNYNKNTKTAFVTQFIETKSQTMGSQSAAKSTMCARTYIHSKCTSNDTKKKFTSILLVAACVARATSHKSNCSLSRFLFVPYVAFPFVSYYCCCTMRSHCYPFVALCCFVDFRNSYCQPKKY